MTEFSLDQVPRKKFCLLPTPLSELPRLTTHLQGGNIYIKRDDLTGMGFGGNKNRKLEFLLADALEQEADTIITEGALQSNHCLQTAACASSLGLNCELVLSGERPKTITGNLLLDQILEVKIHRTKESKDRKKIMQKVAKELKEQGKKPYIIPTGGSNLIGILGYVNFMREIAEQAHQMNKDFDVLVHGSGSAGTQAGILIGKKIYYPRIDILGISAGEPKDEIKTEIRNLVRQFECHWNTKIALKGEEIVIHEKYFGKGYGIPSKEMVETVKLVAQLEGIFLDPVYNGKAMVGLIDLIKKNVIPKDANVLFLHSGGGPSLFASAEVFQREVK
ncbi:MAG: pyridoxal-phosphate dependent enzyme [Candidatus Heimdallarchaeota archaeon]|nr:pyridoxal-phosphate dependent enzyme [Candidatus Heimdallarchaeota archaeon]